MMFDKQGAGLVATRDSSVLVQLRAQFELPGALGEQVTIAQADQFARQPPSGDGEAQLWPDPGRLSGGQGDAR